MRKNFYKYVIVALVTFIFIFLIFKGMGFSGKKVTGGSSINSLPNNKTLNSRSQKVKDRVYYGDSTIQDGYEEIKVTSWKIILGADKHQEFEVTFTFKNKLKKSLNFREYANQYIGICQLMDKKGDNFKILPLDTTKLAGITISPNKKATGVIDARVFDESKGFKMFSFGITPHNRISKGKELGGLGLNVDEN